MKVIQGASHRQRRGSEFSMRVVKYCNKLLASVVTPPSVNGFKKRLEEVFGRNLSPFPPLTEHSPNLPPPLPTCTPPINSFHVYMKPNSLLYVCGFFRPVVAYFLPLQIFFYRLSRIKKTRAKENSSFSKRTLKNSPNLFFGRFFWQNNNQCRSFMATGNNKIELLWGCRT